MPAEHSDPAQEPPDYKKIYIPLGRTESWARREAAKQATEDLRGRANEEVNKAETVESGTIVTTSVRQRRQRPETPAPPPIVTTGTRTRRQQPGAPTTPPNATAGTHRRRQQPEVSDSPPVVISARAVRKEPAQAPETRQTRGGKKIKKESPDDKRPTQQGSGSRRIKEEHISPRNNDLHEASPPRDHQTPPAPEDTTGQAPQQPYDIAGDRRTESEILFDERYPNRVVRRLRTWGGPLYYDKLSPADRANMSSIPGPRKRVRVQ